LPPCAQSASEQRGRAEAEVGDGNDGMNNEVRNEDNNAKEHTPEAKARPQAGGPDKLSTGCLRRAPSAEGGRPDRPQPPERRAEGSLLHNGPAARRADPAPGAP